MKNKPKASINSKYKNVANYSKSYVESDYKKIRKSIKPIITNFSKLEKMHEI